MIFEVDHRWIEDFLFTYLFPVARFIAWVFTVVWKDYCVVSVLFDVFLVDSVLKVAPLRRIPLCMEPVFSIRIRIPRVDGLGRTVWFRSCLWFRR